MSTLAIPPPTPGRISSVDFFRGFTMFLLAGEATGLYEHLRSIDNGVAQFIGWQLEHHEWHGLHFWDLIQPFFMFIVGVAIPFAVANRIGKGETPGAITRHAWRRAFLLLFFGWALYFIDAGTLVFRFQNVLAQLAFTYIVAFLIRDKSIRFQILFSFALLLLIDLAYRLFPLEGYNHPWVQYENLGAWFNNLIEGEKVRSLWATLNFVSTTAHTVWGVLCGKLLRSERSSQQKIRILLAAGVAALAIGYGLDLANITPLIKKVATSSFVFASGGWAILGLCFCYWLVDVRQSFRSGSWFFTVVGSNSIFIYLWFSLGGADFISRMVRPFSALFFSRAGEMPVSIITSLGAWAAMWGMCYWLYRRRLFFKV